MDIIAPDIDAMSADEDSISVRVLVHGFLEELGEVLLVGRVLDDGDAQRVVVAEVPRLLEAAAEALDLLDVVDLEHLAVSALGLEQQRHQHRPLRVRVDAAPGAAPREGREEQRGALRGLAVRRRAHVRPVLEVGLLLLQGQDVEVVRLHQLLLHARRSDVY